ncbi:MAG: NAD(P)/FAD-dependent oxidoreductase [Planctomycetaceae bacterium]|jgi:predicted Rossmann fold flavoprotein|nr:NAD(P)/FAD-dependent oxidoreductase [Planctomycetaceae bacterium]
MYDVLILGAGPAGLAAGIAAAARKQAVCVLERNKTAGKKLLLSGSGQCNLTHSGNVDDFLKHYGGEQKARFVKPALFAFDNTATVQWFTRHGVPLLERDDGKVFPKSLNSDDVLNAMLRELKNIGGVLKTETRVNSVTKSGDGFIVQTNCGEVLTKKLVIATGGSSFPATGADGSGFKFAEALGHKIVTPKPALTPLYTEEDSFVNCAGIAFRQREISVFRNGKKTATGKGDVLLTHHGLSGPGILDLSRFVEQGNTLRIEIGQPTEIRTLLNGKKTLKNSLQPLGVPEQFLVCLLKTLNIPPDKPASEILRTERKLLEDALSGLPFTVKKPGGWNEAMATAGGVSLDEVERQTMRSRLVPNLFFCGEVLDIDGDTGGYNIQFALSSGFKSGEV